MSLVKNYQIEVLLLENFALLACQFYVKSLFNNFPYDRILKGVFLVINSVIIDMRINSSIPRYLIFFSFPFLISLSLLPVITAGEMAEELSQQVEWQENSYWWTYQHNYASKLYKFYCGYFWIKMVNIGMLVLQKQILPFSALGHNMVFHGLLRVLTKPLKDQAPFSLQLWLTNI